MTDEDTMRDLNRELKQLCRCNRDDSFSTRHENPDFFRSVQVSV